VHLGLSWARSRTGRGRRERSPFLDAVAGPEPRYEGSGGGVHRGPGSKSRDSRRRRNDTCRVCGKALVSGREIALGRCESCPSAYDEELFERLRAWRKDEATRQSVPAFVVFSDATLEQIATVLPKDRSALLKVTGIGAKKAEVYGDAVLALVRGETPAVASDPDAPA
jgi:DNA helicase-2/ATP-dependent DNA helicase PcrA